MGNKNRMSDKMYKNALFGNLEILGLIPEEPEEEEQKEVRFHAIINPKKLYQGDKE